MGVVCISRQRLSQAQVYQHQMLPIGPSARRGLLYISGSQQGPGKTQETKHSSVNDLKAHSNLDHLQR